MACQVSFLDRSICKFETPWYTTKFEPKSIQFFSHDNIPFEFEANWDYWTFLCPPPYVVTNEQYFVVNPPVVLAAHLCQAKLLISHNQIQLRSNQLELVAVPIIITSQPRFNLVYRHDTYSVVAHHPFHVHIFVAHLCYMLTCFLIYWAGFFSFSQIFESSYKQSQLWLLISFHIMWQMSDILLWNQLLMAN